MCPDDLRTFIVGMVYGMIGGTLIASAAWAMLVKG